MEETKSVTVQIGATCTTLHGSSKLNVVTPMLINHEHSQFWAFFGLPTIWVRNLTLMLRYGQNLFYLPLRTFSSVQLLCYAVVTKIANSLPVSTLPHEKFHLGCFHFPMKKSCFAVRPKYLNRSRDCPYAKFLPNLRSQYKKQQWEKQRWFRLERRGTSAF